jgi:hypothetical protein
VLLSGAAAHISFSKFLELLCSGEMLKAKCGHRLFADRVHFYACEV